MSHAEIEDGGGMGAHVIEELLQREEAQGLILTSGDEIVGEESGGFIGGFAATPFPSSASVVAADSVTPTRRFPGAQLYELLLSFDPAAFAGSLRDKPELYLGLVNSLARLSEGEAACGHHRAKESVITAKLNPAPTGTRLKPDSLRL